MSEAWFEGLNIGKILQVSEVYGGDINRSYKLRTNDGEFFLKKHTEMKQDFFEAEANGLYLLSQRVRTPKIIEINQHRGKCYILMEWIEPGERDDRKLAEALAHIHADTKPTFGLDQSNYMASFVQPNNAHDNWGAFYVYERLLTQANIAQKKERWSIRREEGLQQLIQQILTFYKESKTTSHLLHGDFWSGNVIFDKSGEPVFIDPAVYYGNREVDISLTKLFGGFSVAFYETYEYYSPLESGWEERLPWYQLYYLLVHLNLFGESYGSAVDRILGIV